MHGVISTYDVSCIPEAVLRAIKSLVKFQSFAGRFRYKKDEKHVEIAVLDIFLKSEKMLKIVHKIIITVLFIQSRRKPIPASHNTLTTALEGLPYEGRSLIDTVCLTSIHFH